MTRYDDKPTDSLVYPFPYLFNQQKHKFEQIKASGKVLWQKNILPKVVIFAWRLFQNRL